jgi:hypothetical protein
MNKIYILYKDYEDYMLHASKDNSVRKFWLQIIAQTHKELIRELNQKRTDLIKQDEKEFDITGAIAYQFETEEASEELKNFLDQYVVLVEHNSEEVLKWKQEIKSPSYLRYTFLKTI